MNAHSLKNLLAAALVAAFSFGSAATLHAQDYSLFSVRLRGIGVVPDISSTITTIGGEVDASETVVPELDLSLFFSPNLSLELILATTKHDIDALSTSLNDVDLGHIWLLPPTLTLQWHFLPDGELNPYVGAGVNYTIFYNGDPGAVTSVEYENAVGLAGQVGADYFLNDNWGVNFDLKKLLLNTEATVDAGGTVVVADVDLDPWVFGAGIVYRMSR